ncbi:MAG: hypothetical protein P4L71_04185 [Acetobacteraceae bacterium]|nr:hypothetical protein [Acetobacteraceae bacterium]
MGTLTDNPTRVLEAKPEIENMRRVQTFYHYEFGPDFPTELEEHRAKALRLSLDAHAAALNPKRETLYEAMVDGLHTYTDRVTRMTELVKGRVTARNLIE